MFNQNQKDAIKQTIGTSGWELILGIFNEEILDGKKPINIKTEGMTNEMIAREVTARAISAKTILKVLNKINSIGSDEKIKKTNYI